jgi:polyphosphate kinase
MAMIRNPVTEGTPGPSDRAAQDVLSSPGLYLSPELAWLEFSRRLLHEAEDARNPLLERLHRVADFSASLDDFFRLRIGGLKRQLDSGSTPPSAHGSTPRERMNACHAVVRGLEARKDALLPRLLAELEGHGIALVTLSRLTAEERTSLRELFDTAILPLLRPQRVEPAQPVPFLSNVSLNLLVTALDTRDGERHLWRVKVPVDAGVPRFLRLGAKQRFVALEEVMAENLDRLLPHRAVQASDRFWVTRDANAAAMASQAREAVPPMDSEPGERAGAPIARIQTNREMAPGLRRTLASALGLDAEGDLFETPGLLGTRHLVELTTLDAPDLRHSPHHPVDHPALQGPRNIFHILREQGAILLQHPYESFSTSVERFLREASEDPKVCAVKMSLPRVPAGDRLTDCLTGAARCGKEVTLVATPRIGADEDADKAWVTRLVQAGVQLTQGAPGPGTLAGLILVVRRDFDGLRRYAHIGTGGYDGQTTARHCTDLAMLTCDEALGRDLSDFFNYLTTGLTPKRPFRKLLTSPGALKAALLARIAREMALHSQQAPGLIRLKTNALEDRDIIRALYEASRAGVRIQLIVGGVCRLRPGVSGVSDAVTVVSTLGRFLEHERICYFRNGGREEYFIGSADLVTAELEDGIAVQAPVESPALQDLLRTALETSLADLRSGWDMQPDGSYVQRRPAEPGTPGSQETLARLAMARAESARAATRGHWQRRLKTVFNTA